MKRIFTAFFVLLCPFLGAQNRTLAEVFPGISEEQRNLVFSAPGLFSASERSSGFRLLPLNIDAEIVAALTAKNPAMLIESCVVLPSAPQLRDVYNALGKIGDLKGRLYYSETRKADIPLFEEASRIDPRRNTVIPDPPPAAAPPRSETVYLRLKDANFGNCYYRGEFSLSGRGLVFRLTNYKTITYILFPVMREEKFTAQLYIEPIVEGTLIYGLAGADVSPFISSRVDIPSTLAKRLAVIISWVSDGLEPYTMGR